MEQNAIFMPFLGMMLLTLAVWIYMYYLRLSFIVRNRLDPQALASNRNVAQNIPEKTNLPAENLANLFELPVIFYALSVYLYVAQQVDTIYIVQAWLFMALRVCHSLIHCTYNHVTQRFSVYILASVALWTMLIRAFADLLPG
jgi:hypothetical protein